MKGYVTFSSPVLVIISPEDEEWECVRDVFITSSSDNLARGWRSAWRLHRHFQWLSCQRTNEYVTSSSTVPVVIAPGDDAVRDVFIASTSDNRTDGWDGTRQENTWMRLSNVVDGDRWLVLGDARGKTAAGIRRGLAARNIYDRDCARPCIST